MQKRIVLLLSCLLLQGCMTAASSSASAIYNRYTLQNTINNQVLAWQVQNKIDNNPQLKYKTHITATNFNDILLLTGQAPSLALSQTAEKTAKSVPNIKKIINRIQIEKPVSTVQKLQDTWITTKIGSQIISSGKLNPDDIKVVTENNTVYLMGALIRTQAEQAIDIARHTDGVNKVITVIYYLEPKIT